MNHGVLEAILTFHLFDVVHTLVSLVRFVGVVLSSFCFFVSLFFCFIGFTDKFLSFFFLFFFFFVGTYKQTEATQKRRRERTRSTVDRRLLTPAAVEK